jgi:predicted flap endonuclease-1-like 5' DNA nuclease
MSKKDKLGLDKVINRFNKEFEKTSSHFNKLVSDAFKQLDTLQSQVQEPIKKIMEDLDKLRDREMNRFQSEFDKRFSEFHELQSQLLEKIGVDQPKPAAKKSVKAPVKKMAPKSKTVSKPSPKKAPAKKAPIKKIATPKAVTSEQTLIKAAPKAKIADIVGIGTATLKKLKEAGISEMSQIAKPNQQEKKTLETFNKVKGFATWQEQANKLLKG